MPCVRGDEPGRLRGHESRVRLRQDTGPVDANATVNQRTGEGHQVLRGHHRRGARRSKPTDSCFVETLNGSLRDEGLNERWFAPLDEANRDLATWSKD
jgi:putative transposase